MVTPSGLVSTIASPAAVPAVTLADEMAHTRGPGIANVSNTVSGAMPGSVTSSTGIGVTYRLKKSTNEKEET